ncbi:MAG: hypothetical protein AAFX01_00220 [Cyanobacteria bacterium J06638_28]
MVNWTQRRKLKRDIGIPVAVLALSIASHVVVLSFPVLMQTTEAPSKVVEPSPEEDIEVVILPEQTPPNEQLSEEEVFLSPEVEAFVPEAPASLPNEAEVEDEALLLDAELETTPETQPDPSFDEGNDPDKPVQSDPPVVPPTPPTPFGENFTHYTGAQQECGGQCYRVAGDHNFRNVYKDVVAELKKSYPDTVEINADERDPGRRVYELKPGQDGKPNFLIVLSDADSKSVIYVMSDNQNMTLSDLQALNANQGSGNPAG